MVTTVLSEVSVVCVEPVDGRIHDLWYVRPMLLPRGDSAFYSWLLELPGTASDFPIPDILQHEFTFFEIEFSGEFVDRLLQVADFPVEFPVALALAQLRS